METCKQAYALVRELETRGMTAATAESCTGGLIAKLITDVSGSSRVFAGGFVTYTNEIKIGVLGVDANVIARDTEVSHACAGEMAARARERMHTDLAVSTTGFAGPGGGTDADPVGTVYIGVSTKNGTVSHRFSASGGATREEVRFAAACRALELLLEAATNG